MISECRSCHSQGLIPVMDLGEQYLSDFREDEQKPPRFPLRVLFCSRCYLAQLDTTVPRDLLYHERYGFKSGVNGSIRADLQDIVERTLELKPDAQSWLDIASNDGTLLSFVPKRIHREGCDPIRKYCLEAEQHADRIVNDFFHAGHFGRRFDVVTSISMFYDLDDPDEFVEDVKAVLAEDGLWVIQQNYLLTTMESNAVDNIVHEHLTYYSLLALDKLMARHGLEVIAFSKNWINGGSFRTIVARKGLYPVHPSVGWQIKAELEFGLHTDHPWKRFWEQSRIECGATGIFVRHLASTGHRIYIYGASTRGGTIWQMAGLDYRHLPKAVERNPEKVGKKIASIGVPIISEEQAREEKPDFMLVSPWFFRDEFLKREAEYLRNGGRFIFPLPQLGVVGG